MLHYQRHRGRGWCDSSRWGVYCWWRGCRGESSVRVSRLQRSQFGYERSRNYAVSRVPLRLQNWILDFSPDANITTFTQKDKYKDFFALPLRWFILFLSLYYVLSFFPRHFFVSYLFFQYFFPPFIILCFVKFCFNYFPFISIRFVKYVSAAAPGSRWDIAVEYEIEEQEEEDDDDNDAAEEGWKRYSGGQEW